MSPCESCHRDHFGTTCSGYPLMLLDDEPAPECASCGFGHRATERCTLCRCEEPAPTALARVVMPVLDELMWRRKLNAPGLTVRTVIDLAQDPEHDEWCDAGCEARGHVYEYVARVGALALLGLSLGSLAPLAAMLGGA